MTFDLGLWRSDLVDPALGEDLLPQAAHLVWEPSGLVGCFSGGGGADVPGISREELDHLLGAALQRWVHVSSGEAEPPAPALDRLLAEVQHGFEAGPPGHQATGVVALLGPLDEDTRAVAIAHVGVDRAYRWRPGGDVLDQLTVDDSLARRHAHQQHPEWFRHVAGAAFRPGHEPPPWTTTTVTLRARELLLLASGIGDTGLELAYLSGALREADPITNAQDLANRLGAIATRFAATSPKQQRAARNIHTRLALSVIWNVEAF